MTQDHLQAIADDLEEAWEIELPLDEHEIAILDAIEKLDSAVADHPDTDGYLLGKEAVDQLPARNFQFSFAVRPHGAAHVTERTTAMMMEVMSWVLAYYGFLPVDEEMESEPLKPTEDEIAASLQAGLEIDQWL